MAFSGGGPQQAEINVTPMIDILLVLIIVFMVVESMSQQKGLEAQIPQPAPNQAIVPPPERTIVIEVESAIGQEKPDLKINRQAVRWEELDRRLSDIFASRVEKVAFLEGDKEIDFDYVAQVIDAAHRAGVAHVGLVTSPPKQDAGLH
jgi:biopolymer transport protein TolR